MSYTMYTPLNVWLDPASVTDVVAYIQTYLSENTIYSEKEIEKIIHDYLIAHPELIGGVQSVNGKTGAVVLSASDINTEDDVTIESVLASLSSQISSIAASVATNTNNITSLTGRVSTAETELSNLNSSIDLEEIVGTNKWNPETVTEGAGINNSSSSPNYGELETPGWEGYYTTDFISVNGGDTVSWFYNANASATTVVSGTMFRIGLYDSNKTVISVSSNWASSPYSTTASTAYVRITVNVNRPLNMVVLNTTASTYTYEAYGLVAESIRIADLEDDVSEIQMSIGEIENPAEVILPSNLYGVTGQQINVYKENLLLNNRIKSLAYIHARMPNDATQDDARAIWNPSTDSLVSSPIDWEIFRNGLTTRYTKRITINTIPKDTGSSTIKVLIIGDSKVANGYVSYHFLHNFDDDNMSCTLLGTQYDWQTDNRNEGYGSKTAKWFCTNEESPFCNNGAFDFANYLSVNSIDTPDYVFINLGTNDCASMSGSDTTFLTEFELYIEQMITSIHSFNSNIVVCIGMCEGVCTVCDTNNSEFLKWDLNQKISRLHKMTIASFDNRQSENIYVCPMYMGMDLTQDYNMTEVPLSQRDGDMNNGQGDGKTRMQITDRIHQNEVGYWKNADYMYALVKYIVAKSLA